MQKEAPDSAMPLGVERTFEQIERELGAGMVPQLFRVLAPRPVLLDLLWGEFREVVLHGRLSRVLKEMVGLVVANGADCEYVRVVHLHSLSLQGVGRTVLDALGRGDYQQLELSALARGALEFADCAVAARTAASAAGGDREMLSAAAEALAALHLSDGEALELVTTVALFEQLCTVANLLALDAKQP